MFGEEIDKTNIIALSISRKVHLPLHPCHQYFPGSAPFPHSVSQLSALFKLSSGVGHATKAIHILRSFSLSAVKANKAMSLPGDATAKILTQEKEKQPSNL